MKTPTPLAVVAALLTIAVPARTEAQEGSPVHADEMSSLEWRDCAGFHFLIADQLIAEGKEGSSKLAETMNGLGIAAIYASEYAAKAELPGGGYGELLADLKTGQLMLRRAELVEKHVLMLQSLGRNAYVATFSAKCRNPVSAFMRRWALPGNR